MPEKLKALNYHTDIEGKGVQEAGTDTDTGSKNPHFLYILVISEVTG